MKKILLIALLLPVFAQGQIIYPLGYDIFTTTFTFSSGDSLTHYVYLEYPADTDAITIDTSSTTLWQIGNTLKPLFSNDTVASHGIMTDTLNPYPANANDFFVLQIGFWQNTIVDVWHKYETDSLHAGGIVEFSTDSGATWVNIVNCSGIITVNFYTSADTINSGQPAFSGTSNGEQLSRFQFMNCEGEKDASTGCPGFYMPYYGSFFVRFRFLSDGTIDSLSGWMIDSIEVEYPGCTGGVDNIANNNAISIFPNPAQDELTIQSTNEPINKVTITNVLGQTEVSPILSSIGNAQGSGMKKISVDISGFPSGVYFVQINGAEVRKFVKE